MSHSYSRAVTPGGARVSLTDCWRETGPLIRIGVAFMVTGVFTMGTAYVIRIIVLRHLGLDATGLYQAAWSLGGVYVAFVLQAMGTDFYPRLTAIANDNPACNRLVNEQAHVSLLLGGPGAILTLTLAPLVIHALYAPGFERAVPVLRWICLGMTLRVIAWPMGFIILAKGLQNQIVLSELAAAIVHVGLAALLVPRIGLTGAGAAFCGLYVWHGLLIYGMVRHQTAFRWSNSNRRLGVLYLTMTVFVFAAVSWLPTIPGSALGLCTAALAARHSTRELLVLVPPDPSKRLGRCLRRAAEIFWVPERPGARVTRRRHGSPMEYTVVIRAKNSAATLPAVLCGILGQTKPTRRVVVIDNGSTDNTRSILPSDVLLVDYRGETFNYARAINQGMDFVDSEFVLILSSHTVLGNPGALAFALELLENNADAAAVYFTDEAAAQLTVEWITSANFDGFNGLWNTAALVRMRLLRARPFRPEVFTAEDQEWARWALEEQGLRTARILGAGMQIRNPRKCDHRKRLNEWAAVAMFARPDLLAWRSICRLLLGAFKPWGSRTVRERLFNVKCAVTAVALRNRGPLLAAPGPYEKTNWLRRPTKRTA